METTILLIVLILFIVFQFGINTYDRKAARSREDDLVAALMAKNLSEYALASAQLKPTTRERIKKIKEENKLALKAAQLAEDQIKEHGIPVT